MLTAAKTGVSACRAFHQAASEPCGSVSIKATGPDPAASASTPRCPDRVVLPTPPFWAQKARTCIMRNYVSTYVRKYVSTYMRTIARRSLDGEGGMLLHVAIGK